eukprot:tig00000903_g5511.t1
MAAGYAPGYGGLPGLPGLPVLDPNADLPPLWAAAARGDASLLKRLLASYPQTVNEPWRQTNVMPIQVAVKEGHVACVRLLLKARADITSESPIDRKNPLSIAAAAGNAEICEAILAAAGPYARELTNKRNSDGSTPLLLAAQFGHGRTVAKLLEYGANALIVEEDGLSAIEVGIREAKREVVQALAAGSPLPPGREAGVVRAIVALCKADTPVEAIVKQPSAGRLNIALMMLIQAKWLVTMRRVGADEGRHLVERCTNVAREVLDGYEAYYQLNVDRRKSGFRSVAQIVMEDALNAHQGGDEGGIRRALSALVPKVEGLPREFARLQTDLWNVFAEGRALGRSDLGLRARDGVLRFLGRPREDAHEVLSFTFERGLEPTAKALAVRCGAPEVISHPFLTRYVHDVWWGNGYEVDFREEKALKEKVARTPFSRTAAVKFFLDSAFYVALLGLLTTIVVRPYGHGVGVEAAFWAMAILWWISEILKVAFVGTTQYSASIWNWLDAIINILLFVAAAWRLANWVAGLNGPNEGYSKELLAALTIPMYFRLLPVFGVFRPVGHAIVVIEKMVTNIFTVSFVIAVGFFGFSVCITFFLQRGAGDDGPVWIFFNNMWFLFENTVGDMHFDSKVDGLSVTALRMVHRCINGLVMLYLLIALFTNSVHEVMSAGRTEQAAQKVYVSTALMYSSRSIVTIPPFGVLYLPFAILCSPTRAEAEMRRFYEAIIYFIPDMLWYCVKFVFGCLFAGCANFWEACGWCRCRPAWQDFRRYVVRNPNKMPNDGHPALRARVPSVMVPPGALAGSRQAAARAAAAPPQPRLSFSYAAPAKAPQLPPVQFSAPAPAPAPVTFQAPAQPQAPLPPQGTYGPPYGGSVFDVSPSAHDGSLQQQQQRGFELPPNAYERPRYEAGPPQGRGAAYASGRRSGMSERDDDGIMDSIGRWFKDDLMPVFTGRTPERRSRRDRDGRSSGGRPSSAAPAPAAGSASAYGGAPGYGSASGYEPAGRTGATARGASRAPASRRPLRLLRAALLRPLPLRAPAPGPGRRRPAAPPRRPSRGRAAREPAGAGVPGRVRHGVRPAFAAADPERDAAAVAAACTGSSALPGWDLPGDPPAPPPRCPASSPPSSPPASPGASSRRAARRRCGRPRTAGYYGGGGGAGPQSEAALAQSLVAGALQQQAQAQAQAELRRQHRPRHGARPAARPPTARRAYSGAATPVPMAPMTACGTSAASAQAAVAEALALSTGRAVPPPSPGRIAAAGPAPTLQQQLQAQAQALNHTAKVPAVPPSPGRLSAVPPAPPQAQQAQLQAQLQQLQAQQYAQQLQQQQLQAQFQQAAGPLDLSDVEVEEEPWDEEDADRVEDAYRAYFSLPDLSAGPRAVRPEDLPEPYVDLVTPAADRDETDKDAVSSYVQDEIMARRPAAASRKQTPAQRARALRGLARRLDALAAGQARLAEAVARVQLSQAQLALQLASPGGPTGAARSLPGGAGGPAGTIVARVIEARGLKSEDWLGKSDPYALLKVGNRTKRTKTISNTTSPVWNEEIAVEFSNGPGEQEVVLQLWDEDVGMPDDFLGQAKLPAAQLLSGAPLDQWLPLTSSDGRSAVQGQVHVVFQYVPGGKPAPRPFK